MERRLSDFMSDIMSRDAAPGSTMDASLADELGLSALRQDLEYLTELGRKEDESLHEGIELVSEQLQQGGPQAPTEEMQQLAEALVEEERARCANNDYLQQELVELSGKVEELWSGI